MGEKHMAEMKCPLEQAEKWASHLMKLQAPFAFPALLAKTYVEVFQLYLVQSDTAKQVQVMQRLLDTKETTEAVTLA